jgi:FkbM family methyltransferase
MPTLVRHLQLILIPPDSLRYKAARRLLGIFQKRTIENDLKLIRSSNLFDPDWYLSHNPDVADAGVDPLIHYLKHGGFEGRDPGPNFSSSWYLDTYKDVKEAGLNPLVHFLKYGRQEGRSPQPKGVEFTNSRYRCPVCQRAVSDFLPLPTFYVENLQRHGFAYTREEGETINFEQYACPHCGASDRDRLYACYLQEKLLRYEDQALLLDIAPSPPLSSFISGFKKITHYTADLLMEGVDHVIDITDMPEIETNSYDILICSHVLEHVDDDKKALSELYRVLKSGGWGIIMVPIILTLDQIDEDPRVTDVAERWRRFGQDDHVRLYNKSGFVERVKEAGFTLNSLGMDYFGEEVFKKYGITKTSVLYIVEKTNEDDFINRVQNLIRENSYYEFPEMDEFDLEPRWNEEVRIVHSQIKRGNIQESAFEDLKINYDLGGLEFTYHLLNDEYSREMLLRVVVARVMGPLKARFPLYYSHIWKYYYELDRLQESNSPIHVAIWDFYLYDLRKLGFDIKLYYMKAGIFTKFLLEQYKYKNLVFAEEGDYVLDGGACYGDTGLYFAERVKDKGKVFSFEFIKENIKYFRKNMELNPEKHGIIELIERPLWSNSGTQFSAIESGPGSRLSNVTDDAKHTQPFSTISIDDFVAQNKIGKIDFIKLDIEGAELEALKGAVETLTKHKPRLAICLYHKNSDFWEIPRFLKELVPQYEFYLDHFMPHALYETVLFARKS